MEAKRSPVNGRRKKDNRSKLFAVVTPFLGIMSLIVGIYYTVNKPISDVRTACAADVADLRDDCEAGLAEKADEDEVREIKTDVKEILHTMWRWEGRDEATKSTDK